jgi:hypothetical protein
VHALRKNRALLQYLADNPGAASLTQLGLVVKAL